MEHPVENEYTNICTLTASNKKKMISLKGARFLIMIIIQPF